MSRNQSANEVQRPRSTSGFDKSKNRWRYESNGWQCIRQCGVLCRRQPPNDCFAEGCGAFDATIFQRNRGEASLLLCALDVSRAFFATRNQLLTAMHPVVRWFCAEMMLRTSTEQAPTRTSAPSNPRVVLTAKQLGRRGPVWVSESEPLLNSSHPNRVVGCQYHRHRAESFPRSW